MLNANDGKREEGRKEPRRTWNAESSRRQQMNAHTNNTTLAWHMQVLLTSLSLTGLLLPGTLYSTIGWERKKILSMDMQSQSASQRKLHARREVDEISSTWNYYIRATFPSRRKKLHPQHSQISRLLKDQASLKRNEVLNYSLKPDDCGLSLRIHLHASRQEQRGPPRC
jgi:hypothetical protein